MQVTGASDRLEAGGPMKEVLQRADRAVATAETAVLVFVVATILVLAFAQVVLKMLGAGVQWVEMLSRYLVLWVGFLGGAVASHQGRHITIDVVSRFVKGPAARAVSAVVSGVSFALCAVLLVISCSFVSQKVSDGSVAFAVGATDIPEWGMVLVVPVGFGLMAWHFAVQTLGPVQAEQGGGA